MREFILTLAVAVMVSAGTAVVTAPIGIADAEAKGFRSSSSFSRSSFRSSSFSSSKRSGSFWSKPKTTKAKTGAKAYSSSDGTKKGSLKTGGTKKVSIAQQKQATRTKAVLDNKRQQAKFKKPATVPGLKTSGGKKPSRIATNQAYRDTYKTNPVYNNARRSDPSTYWDRRGSYYSGYSAPTYIYDSSPSFGMWDAFFLYHILDNNNHAGSFAHNQQNDPGYQQWRTEAENLAKDNADLRAKLAAMDSEAAKLAGSPINPGYLPTGVDADIALAQGARQSALPEFKVCVGGQSGAYFLATAGVIAPNADLVNTIPVLTQGTGQALEYVKEGKCDGAFVQGDGYWNYIEQNQTADLPFRRWMSPYKEAVHVFCHEDGPSKISQLGKNHKLWFPAGSGAAVTMTNWIEEDSDYADIQTVLNNPRMTVNDNATALMKVTDDVNSCMMYVAAPGATEFLRNANAGAKANKIVLIDINDSDFNDTEDPSGNDVYNFIELDQSLYGNLTRQAGAVWGGGDIQTLAVNADFIVADAWKEKHEALYPQVRMQVTGLQGRIKQVVKPTAR